ncbi:MAG: response regulator transcription factor [Eubacterium sp.]|nr:response regulator transcription factor [Eubacterium sp.]
MKNYRILIVEDDPDINGLLERLLVREGYGVRPAFSGTEAQLLLEREDFDLVLLDLMLPGMTGEALMKLIRDHNQSIGVIVISAKTALEDRVALLRAGADDFILKPFELEEVLARVEAQLRRVGLKPEQKSGERLIHGDLVMDTEAVEVTLKGVPVALTAREFKILKLLMTHPKKVFTRENLFNQVWEDDFFGEDNTVNVHISNIRGKLSKIDREHSYIKTVWGIGFRLAD